MDPNAKKMIDKIEQRSNISVDDIYSIAKAIQYEDLSDEATLRSLIRRLSNLANRPISTEKEDEIIRSIKNNDAPTSMESLQRFLD